MKTGDILFIIFSILSVLIICFWDTNKIARLTFNNQHKPIFKLKFYHQPNYYKILFSCNGGLTFSEIKYLTFLNTDIYDNRLDIVFGYYKKIPEGKKEQMRKECEKRWKTYDDILNYEKELEKHCDEHNKTIKNENI